MTFALKFSLSVALVAVTLRLSMASECSSLATKESLYVHLNLVNRMYNNNPYQESLLPRPLMRRRNKEQSDQKIDVASRMLSLIQHEKLAARMSQHPLGNAMLRIMKTVRKEVCTYVKREFEIDCNKAGEMERTLKLIKIREMIKDVLPIVSPHTPLTSDPSCSCLQELFPDRTLKNIAITSSIKLAANEAILLGSSTQTSGSRHS